MTASATQGGHNNGDRPIILLLRGKLQVAVEQHSEKMSNSATSVCSCSTV